MEKRYSRVFAACLALGLAACGAEGSSSGTASKAAGGTGSAAESTSGGADAKENAAPVEETIGDFDLDPVITEFKAPEDFSFETEAESAELGGSAAVMTSDFAGDYTGDGFVAMPVKGDTLQVTAEIPAKGKYDVVIRAAVDSKGIYNYFTVDGEDEKVFKGESDKFDDLVVENVLLEEGTHTVGINATGSHIFVDSIRIVPSAADDPARYAVTAELSNPNASDNAKRLYSFLRSTYGKYIISGQYSGNNEGKESREFKEIAKHTGKTPVILGLDVGGLGLSSIEKGTGGGDMVPIQAMDWYNNENGIVTFCWHWIAPGKYLEANGQPWWRGFYTDSVSIDLAKIMNGQDQEGYDLLVAELDNMAEQLKPLAEADVPILWRPLHEAAGDPRYPNNQWFWWGAGGKDAYLKLWDLMYDKFTNEYGLNNLIWVWNGQDPEWYPGDDKVDIIGDDIYPDEHDSSAQKEHYDRMASCSPTGSKIIAETENGAIIDPDKAFNDAARWAYFGTWNGEFCIKDMQLSDQYTTFEMWEKVYTSDRVLTLDEMPDLKAWPMDIDAFLAG
ncbi:MAG: beta-mannosidase [Ruminococcus sp.]|nr:beta-mannosidase [Ruminococcus sp.]